MRIQWAVRPLAACSGFETGRLFSAWHATTHASQPVHRSRSIAIPQRCSIYSFALSVRGLLLFAVRRRELNPAAPPAGTRETDPCGAALRPENRNRIGAASRCVTPILRVPVPDRHAGD